MSQVAQRLAEMTGCKLVDGFKTRVFDEEILVVIIDCGGSRRFFYCVQLSIYDNKTFDGRNDKPKTLFRSSRM